MQYSEEIVSTKKLKTDLICFWKLEGFLPPNDIKSARFISKGQSLLVFNFGSAIETSKGIIDNSFFVVPFISESLIINQSGDINLFGVSFLGDGLFKLFK